MKVVELFAGIGSQRKALENLGLDFEIVNIAEWYIAAILAYDSIHHGVRDLDSIKDLSIDDILKELEKYTFSTDGKKPIKKENLRKLGNEMLRNLYIANRRTNNLVSIDKVKAHELPNGIDLLTYSFPCQDLSNAGAVHGYRKGIDKNVDSRSGLLWQVERLLMTKHLNFEELPRILLMENVSSLLSKRHNENFEMWKDTLKNLGYINEVKLLNASSFGLPQNRQRIFMISVKTNDLSTKLGDSIMQILKENIIHNGKEYRLEDLLKTDYNNNNMYKREADEAQPNNTVSRREIFTNNRFLYGDFNEREVVNECSTITTRQDRHPNAGVIYYPTNKNNFRLITAREAFLLMGFTEEDYESIEKSNFYRNRSKKYFTRDKYYILAGNSIAVTVLEAIFNRIDKIYRMIKDSL